MADVAGGPAEAPEARRAVGSLSVEQGGDRAERAPRRCVCLGLGAGLAAAAVVIVVTLVVWRSRGTAPEASPDPIAEAAAALLDQTVVQEERLRASCYEDSDFNELVDIFISPDTDPDNQTVAFSRMFAVLEPGSPCSAAAKASVVHRAAELAAWIGGECPRASTMSAVLLFELAHGSPSTSEFMLSVGLPSVFRQVLEDEEGHWDIEVQAVRAVFREVLLQIERPLYS